MRLILPCLTFVFLCAAASAQIPAQSTPTAPAVLPASNVAAINNALKDLPAQNGLNDVTRKQVEDLLHQALDANSRADEFAQQLRSLRPIADTAEINARKLEEALAHDDSANLATWRASLPANASDEQLNAMLSRENDALNDARNASETLATEIHTQRELPDQMRDELSSARATLDRSSNAPFSDQPASTSVTTAQRLLSYAERRLATTQIALLELEGNSYEPRMRLLSAQRRDRQHAVDQLSQHVVVLENLILSRTSAEIAELKTRVSQQRTDLGPHSKLLAEAAEINVTLCDQLEQTIARLTELSTQQQVLDTAQQDTDQALQNTEERIRIGGVSEAVGLILLAEQRKLQPLPLLQRRLAALQNELAKTRMELINLRERQASLLDANVAVDQILARQRDASAAPANLRADLLQLITTRAEIVPRLLAQETRLADTLTTAEQELNSLTTTTAKLSATLNERLLWTPNYTPVDLAWIERLPADTVEFFAPQRWTHAAGKAFSTAIGMPFFSALAILAVFALLWLRRRARTRLQLIAALMRRVRTDRYMLTSEALVWTILAATPLPLTLWLLSRLLQQNAASGNGFADDLASSLLALVLPAAVVSFMRSLTMEQGLAHYHFRWPRSRREALFKITPIMTWLFLPILFLIVLMARPGIESPQDTVGRFLLVATSLGLGWLSWKILAPGRLWTIRGSQLPEPVRLRQLARVAFLITCLELAALDLLGYALTTEALGAHLLKSLAAVLGIATLNGLAVRWLVLGERRLELKRAQDKLQSADVAAVSPEGEALPELPEADEITIANVSAQTRRLLRTLTVLLSITVLLWIWSDITPALSLLGNIIVWDSSDTIAGKEIILHISLRDVLASFVVFVLTWVATRNLPGLLEVGVLRRFNIDAPTRYAFTSLTRYLILFTGTIFGVAMLGLRWANLQWLAAGFSVGLGFGMQEIFANFISGLIVLFERPFRIGDIITIGNIEGTVARIRTRATTIIDWDNREVVVPNKSFITDRLVNWTLTDTTTRLVIKVGIAYRNDAALAQNLLLAVAEDNPQVLKDPAPTCWIMGLSPSTQDLELRVYVGEIGQRNPTRTDLQLRIVEVFRENDIELAFPQMDLWLRNEVQVQAPETAKQQAPRKP